MNRHEEPKQQILLAQLAYPRRHDLDALRAFAMLLGIALHAGLSFVPFPWPVQDTHQNEWFGLFFAAVHGFRMPLFFLLSGFFTAMLWRRRGLKSLLWHRFRRVFLPLLLGLFTIVPAVTVVSIVAYTSGQRDRSEVPDSTSSEITTAARAGDIPAIKRHLADGADINAADSGGTAPIAWVAIMGHNEALDLLLDEGADIDVSNKDGATALHLAALFGRAAIADSLIKSGADINSANNQGHTPHDVLAVDWGTTKFIADLVKVEIDEEKVRIGRARITELLLHDNADSSTARGDRRDSRSADMGKTTGLRSLANRLTVIPVFHHLWFLWFLCWLFAAFAVYAKIADWLKWHGPRTWLMVSPARWLWLVPLTMIPQSFMGLTVAVFGPDTSVGLLPMPHVLLYYALFFGFGALYFDCDDEDGRIGRSWWIMLPMALLIVFPLGLELSMGVFGLRDRLVAPEWQRPVSGVLQVIYAWAMTFSFMGLFQRMLKRESKTARYISDSSYWLYLAHVPLVIGVQLVVRDWPLPAGVKFALVCLVITAFLLLTYQTLVRYTWLGTLLNGPRKRPQSEIDPTVADPR